MTRDEARIVEEATAKLLGNITVELFRDVYEVTQGDTVIVGTLKPASMSRTLDMELPCPRTGPVVGVLRIAGVPYRLLYVGDVLPVGTRVKTRDT
jgi:hypothetical protein